MKKNYLAHIYNRADTILEIRIKIADRTIYREVIPLNDKKKIRNAFAILDYKGFLNINDIFKREKETWVE